MDGRCKYTQRPALPESGSFVFSHTDFIECSNDAHGGAIYLSFDDLSTTALSIDDCLFTDCYCQTPSNGQCGGSIYIESISSLSVAHSSFEWTYSDTTQANYGGAMFLSDILFVTISDDTFTNCYVTYSGGAIYIQTCSSGSNTDRLMDDCRFFQCTGSSYAAGGVCIDNNKQYNNFLTNSLFSECSSIYGGALYLYYASSFYPSSSSEEHPVQFSFFNMNSFLSGGAGNDIYFHDYCPEDTIAIFQHCFSTTSLSRVVFWQSSAYLSTDVDWLPLGDI